MLLCIDDNATALQIRKVVLESAGYFVLAASDSATAMQLFSSSPVDLVISDYFLQSGTGTELAAAMKQLEPEVPIVILSGALEPLDRMEHADMFICKNESPPDVLRKISELLKTFGLRKRPLQAA